MEKKKRSTGSTCFIVTRILITLVPALILTVLLIVFREHIKILEVGEARQANAESYNLSTTEEIEPPNSTPDYGMENNMFKTMMTKFAAIYNLTDCYVCTQFPSSATDIMRYMSVALSQSVSCKVFRPLLKGSVVRGSATVCTQSNKTKTDKQLIKTCKMIPRPRQIQIDSKKPTHYLLLDLMRKGELCIRVRDPRDKMNPNSRIKREYAEGMQISEVLSEMRGQEVQVKKQLKEQISGVLKGMEQVDKDMEEATIIKPNIKEPTINMGSSECSHYIELKESNYLNGNRGMYYVCGKEAYFYLPEGWFGSCYLAFVFPPMTHFPKMPQQPTRSKRAAEWLWDMFGAMMPPAGVAVNSMRINKLALLIEDLADEDASALGNVTDEMTAMRAVVIQNRMVLDIMLAKENGVCGLLHTKCCMYIPDNSQNIKRSINHIHKIATDAHDMATSLWSSVGTWLASWGATVLKYVLIVLAVLLGICTCIQILPLCISKCISGLCKMPKIRKDKDHISDTHIHRRRIYNHPEDIPDQRHPLETAPLEVYTVDNEQGAEEN